MMQESLTMKGNQPVDAPVVEEGAIAYWSTLPMKAIVKKLREEGIPSFCSTDGRHIRL